MKIDAKFKGALIIAALLMTIGAQEARAVPLIPGTAVPPDPATLPIPGLLATKVDTFSTGGGLGLMTGFVTTRVYANDPAHDPLSLGGLIFTYDVHITSALPGHTLQSVSLIDWLGIAADAYQTVLGAKAITVSLDAGGTIHFNDNTALTTSTFGSGDSATFILVSDATSFKDSFFSVQDGLADNGSTLAPSKLVVPPPVPDGSLTVALLGIGILGLGVFRKTVSA